MEPIKRPASTTDYLANERTFLAWIRTSFVVFKFSLFVKQISMLIDSDKKIQHATTHTHYSAAIGIFLVGLGMFSIILSYVRYRITNKQLNEGVYQHSTSSITVLTAFIFMVAVALIFYLMNA
jgi:putative membrane protein